MASYRKNVKAVFNTKVGEEFLLQLKDEFVYAESTILDHENLAYNAGQRDLILRLFKDAKLDLKSELPNVNNFNDEDL